jgi:hypothetical protein
MPTVFPSLVAVSIATIRKAEAAIGACQECDPTADVPFSELLGHVAPSEQQPTQYVMSEPARCSRCGEPVLEHTLVELL